MRSAYALPALPDEGCCEVTGQLVRNLNRLLENSSDIAVIYGEGSGWGTRRMDLGEDPPGALRALSGIVARYLVLFDFIGCDTFDMLVKTAAAAPSLFTCTELSHREVTEERFYHLCRLHASFPLDADIFMEMLLAGEERRKEFLLGRRSLVSPPRLNFEDECFEEEAMCCRDRALTCMRLPSNDPDTVWERLTDRYSLFDERHILPDEAREESMVLDRIIAFCAGYGISGEYYVEAVRKCITEEEYMKARKYVREGLSAFFRDNAGDRDAVSRLEYYDMILEDDPKPGALKADRILERIPVPEAFDASNLCTEGKICLEAAFRYLLDGQTQKAESLADRLLVPLLSCMESGGEVGEVWIEADDRFRLLFLKAGILDRQKRADEAVRYYILCRQAAKQIHDCIYVKGYHILSILSRGDMEYVLKRAGYVGKEEELWKASKKMFGRARRLTVL